MWISRTTRLMGLVAMVVTVALLPGRALAAAPSITPYDGNGVFTFASMRLTADCGFTDTTIMETLVIQQNVITYSDGTTKFIESGPNSVSYSTPYGTVTGRIAGFAVNYPPNQDGAFISVGVGPGGFTTVPGAGPVFGGAGRFVGLFDSNGHLIGQPLQDVGVRPDNLAAFCTYLGPPGYTFPV